MSNEEECLRRFGLHSRSFYDSSLILHPSSSSLSSMQEEKKAEEQTIYASDTKKRAADGKIVIETLDRIIAIHSIVVSTHQPQQEFSNALQKSITIMRREHASVVEQHNIILEECGLVDIDRFIGSSNPADETSRLLHEYTKIRDAMRRRSHKISMLHRQNSLFELLELTEPSSTDTDTSTSSSKPKNMTQLKYLQHTFSIIQKFVSKYQSNIGSHPFLAGLHRIINLQLNPIKPNNKMSSKDPSYIVRWKFRGSVLTEACRSCHGKNNENEDDELAYAREAIKVLFSFLVWIKDVDVEGGSLIIPIGEHEDHFSGNHSSQKEHTEPNLSFEIGKHISNANLLRILALLPNPKRLDARATGSVEVLDSCASDIIARANVDGHEDEHWPWFARLEFCTLL